MADIIDLRSFNMAGPTADFAWVPSPNSQLEVTALRGIFDARIDLDLNNNPMHVVLLQSYGLPFDPYIGAHTPIPVAGVGGWTLDSDNPIENIQEYKRWWNPTTGQALIQFTFTTVEDILTKARFETNTVGSVPFCTSEVPYKERHAQLIVRSSLNERVEIWREDNSTGYTQGDGSPIRVARMSIQFDRYRE